MYDLFSFDFDESYKQSVTSNMVVGLAAMLIVVENYGACPKFVVNMKAN